MYQYMSLGIKPAGVGSELSVSGLRASDQYMNLSVKPAGISSVPSASCLRASVQYYRYQACGHQCFENLLYLRVSDSDLGQRFWGTVISSRIQLFSYVYACSDEIGLRCCLFSLLLGSPGTIASEGSDIPGVHWTSVDRLC